MKSKELKAYQQTVNHIQLVQRILLSAQLKITEELEGYITSNSDFSISEVMNILVGDENEINLFAAIATLSNWSLHYSQLSNVSLDKTEMLKEHKQWGVILKNTFPLLRNRSSVQYEILKRVITHDITKLQSPEVEMFAQMTHKLASLTYGSKEYTEQLEVMKTQALGHHYEHNRHHPEFFSNGVEGMNLFDILEMLIDWIAAVRRHDDGNIYDSIQHNIERFGLSSRLAIIMRNTVPLICDRFAHFHSQKDI